MKFPTMTDSKPPAQAAFLSLSSSTSSTEQQDNVLESEELLFKILNYCDETTRCHFLFLSSKHYTLLTSEASYKWRVECLHHEMGIYHPPTLPKNNMNISSWKDVFVANHKIKHVWQKTKNPSKDKKKNEYNDEEKKGGFFNIQVSARFKPRNTNPYDENEKISLPLYQRLALIQTARNLKTKKEAFKALVEQGEWSTGDEVMKNDTDRKEEDRDEEDEEKKVEEQVKPTLRGGVHLIDPKDNFAVLIDPTKGLRKFDFDNVFHEDCSQFSVYEKTTMPLIWEYMNGFNVSCIVYGQTGR